MSFTPEQEKIFRELEKDDVKNFFQKMLTDAIKKMNDAGIKKTDIKVGENIANDEDDDSTKADPAKREGWIIKNTENKYCKKLINRYKIYSVIQDGIEIQGTVIRYPVVNVYTQNN